MVWLSSQSSEIQVHNSSRLSQLFTERYLDVLFHYFQNYVPVISSVIDLLFLARLLIISIVNMESINGKILWRKIILGLIRSFIPFGMMCHGCMRHVSIHVRENFERINSLLIGYPSILIIRLYRFLRLSMHFRMNLLLFHR